MNVLHKIIYFILELKEKSLRKKLSKYFKTGGRNSTTKTFMSSSVTVTLNSQTEKNVEFVKNNVSDIVKSCNLNPEKLLSYIESGGTKVFRCNNADKLLAVIGEEEGFVTPLEGIEALYINWITHSGFSFKSKPMFVLRYGQIDAYYMAHQFYRWYALKSNLPGFDYMSQKLFKIFLNSDASKLSELNLDEMIGLKEAINRDKEATDFALTLAKQKDGSKKVLEKMQKEGADI